jgi:hypothetical protein
MSRPELALALVLITSLPARADSIEGSRPSSSPSAQGSIDASITTLLAGRQDPRDGRVYTVVPAYELLQLRADFQTRYVTDLKLVVSAWGEVAFGEDKLGALAGDVDIGYLEGKLFDQRVTLRLGRQLVWAGGARMFQLDGGLVRARLYRGLHVEAWGGAPVTPRFAVRLGDAAIGGRVSYRHSIDTEVGLSFLHVLDRGRVARQDLGVDGRWVPLRVLQVTGYLLYSVPEQRLAEVDLGISAQPHLILDLRVEYRRTAPDLFLPRSSILSVFADTSRDEVGTAVWVRPLEPLTLRGDYYLVADPAGLGHRAGARATLRLGASGQTTLGAEGRLLRLPQNGYTEARLFSTHRLPRDLFLALDLDAYLLEQPVRGATLSLTGAATVGWDFARFWRATLTGLADTTPLVERRFEVLVKLAYNHTWRIRERRP